MTEVIVAEGLTKYYDGRVGIEDVSFSVRRGEAFAYLGPNGAGKTTTIRLLLGFMRPTRGRAIVMGVDTREDRLMTKVKAEIGYLAEDFTLPRGLKGKEVLRHFAEIRGVRSRAEEIFSILPLDLEKRVEEYSKGMRQILAIALALSHDPDLLILDEPTTGLDPLMRDRLLGFLREEVRRGKTVFFSSHVLGEVQKVADRVCLIKGGKVVSLEDLPSLLSKLGKIVRARLSKPLDLKKLEGLGRAELTEGGREVTIVAEGKYSEILTLLAEYGIEDIEVRNMTLEEAFLHIYRR
ncbi:MAG: ABC transporter ATP-binding protein [Acidilobaceae archaeon]|nr:ABC transporter ATP-binding protein [Acidilobaceae archaeon]MCX8165017.1 ABC transporter ATP-binding protein [Acidilobaceae archaeon]MDW7974466.1 ABC transporter ATP-binding protein [Sulfolobales archaeon]